MSWLFQSSLDIEIPKVDERILNWQIDNDHFNIGQSLSFNEIPPGNKSWILSPGTK